MCYPAQIVPLIACLIDQEFKYEAYQAEPPGHTPVARGGSSYGKCAGGNEPLNEIIAAGQGKIGPNISVSRIPHDFHLVVAQEATIYYLT
jgi:hypothetical protein